MPIGTDTAERLTGPASARRKRVKKPKAPPKLRSGFEKKIADYLREKGVDFEYETRRIAYTVPAKNKNYVPDFILPNGIFVEAKGKLDREARDKMLLVIKQNPDKDIRILLMRNNKMSKQSKMRYGDWLDKHNIQWAVSDKGVLPDAWLV
jgi:hypothetical protein